MFIFPMRIEKDGEFILISDRSELQRFVDFAKLYLDLTQPTGKQPTAPVPDVSKESVFMQTKTPASREVSNDTKTDKPLSQRRAERIYEVGRKLGPFVARDIGKIVASEPLFQVPGGDPKHVIRNAIRENPHLFTRADDGSSMTVTVDLQSETVGKNSSQDTLFRESSALSKIPFDDANDQLESD